MDKRQKFLQSYMTTIIVAVLFIVFIVECMLGGSENTSVLLKMGAMYNPVIVIKGQWWRLFTAQFLHIGIMHIASNAIMVWYMGQYVEPILGHWRFLLLYLLSGVGGNLLTLAFGSDQTLSAGASTALFGLMGAMISIGLKNRDSDVLAFLGRQALALAVINLVLDLFIPDVDILGHLGGLVSGILLEIILGDKTYRQYGRLARFISAIVLIICVALTLRIGMTVNL